MLKIDKEKRDKIWKRMINSLVITERQEGGIPEKVLKQYPYDFEKLCKDLKIDLGK